MSYKSVAAPCEREKVIEKSRFLTYAAHTAGEEEARAFLASVRAQHPLATHVCYAFIADRLGNLQRFSDDGEPQGTAGMPILNVIKAQELYETTVAVVRYFGGIKLGAGGLTRAYSSCAAETLSAAEKCLYDVCAEYCIRVGYPEVNALTRFLEGRCVIVNRAFEADAAFTVQVREGRRRTSARRSRTGSTEKCKFLRKVSIFRPFRLKNNKRSTIICSIK